MLTNVTILGDGLKTFDLVDGDPDASIILESISGLTSADAELFTGEYARDGSYYRGRRIGGRNPVFNFKLNPDYVNDVDISEIREDLQALFMNGSPEFVDNSIRVILKDDKKPEREFRTYVEKFDNDLFSRETRVQVSTLMVDPYIKATLGTSKVLPSGTSADFSDYEGSAPCGLIAEFRVKQANSYLTISTTAGQMNLARSFAVGDIIRVNSIPGQRSLTLNGVDCMSALSGPYQWPGFNRGGNNIQVGIFPRAEIVSYSYTPLWWGI